MFKNVCEEAKYNTVISNMFNLHLNIVLKGSLL